MTYKVTYYGGEVGDDWEDETELEGFEAAVGFCNNLLAKNRIFISDVQLPYKILSIELVANDQAEPRRKEKL